MEAPAKAGVGGAAGGALASQLVNGVLQWLEGKEAAATALAGQTAYTQLLAAFQDVVTRCGGG